jgi:hypothetical protein
MARKISTILVDQTKKILFLEQQRTKILPSTHQPLRSISRKIQLQINCIIQQAVIYVSNVQGIDHIACQLQFEQRNSINFMPSRQETRKNNSNIPSVALEIVFSAARLCCETKSKTARAGDIEILKKS